MFLLSVVVQVMLHLMMEDLVVQVVLVVMRVEMVVRQLELE